MPQPILELRHLRTLTALRDTGSLVRAAQWLNLTQSALSHQIKQLEEHYGAALFERKSVPPRFTTTGERLLQLADTAMPLFDAAERDVARLATGAAGKLRIVVECHTCFDWLMPAMDAFRQRWPEVELDIVSGFHPDPISLVLQRRAEVAVVSEADPAEGDIDHHPLFRFEIMALVANEHPLAKRPHLTARHFADQTLITYPVPDDMLDIVRQVLAPAGVEPAARRTTELTVAMLQLVASNRGIATLPLWAVQPYIERGYVTARRIGAKGLTGQLFLASSPATSAEPWLEDFVQTTRATCFRNLPAIELL